MDYKKIILYVATALVGVALYNAWMRDHQEGKGVTPSQQVSTSGSQTASQTSQTASGQSFAPSTYAPEHASMKKTQKAPISSTLTGKTIDVTTDVFAIKLSLVGGDVVANRLLKYPVAINSPKDFIQIQSRNPNKLYLTQSGITNSTKNGKTAPIVFRADQSSYVLKPGHSQLIVALHGTTANGLAVTKTYTFDRNSYLIRLSQRIQNTATKAWSGSYYQQITRRDYAIKQSSHMRSFTGVSYSTATVPYEKLKFKTIDSDGFKQNIKNGWIAMQQPYFLSAWIPEQHIDFHYYAHVSKPTEGDLSQLIYSAGYVSPQVTLQPHAHSVQSAKLYVGPEISSRLVQAAPNLKYTIDYGWLAPISIFLFWVMLHIQAVVGNWGWTIILVTLMIKIVLYYPSAISYRSMARMRDVAPRLKALKDRHGDDKQAISRATMEIYKSEKVNPMGGCLPMLIQVPIFIGLYYVLLESVQLRQAPFIFWIHDLATKDPYYVLPLLMGVSMFLQQRLNPAPPDPTQAKVMMFMPVIFTVVFITFPAGLVLYWLTNNCVSILQQWYIMKTFNPKADKKKKSSKKKRK